MAFRPKLTSKKEKTIPVPDSDASITIQYVKPGIMQAIVQATMSVTAKAKDGSDKMSSEISFSTYDKNRAVVAECLIGWSGFEGERGGKLKFSAVNVARMMEESDEFIDFVIEEHEKFADEVEEAEPEAEKN